MISLLKRFWAAAPVATVILGLSLAVGAFFLVRITAFWIYWSDPAHRDVEIAAWMTPGYVAHSWQVPVKVVADAVHISFPSPQGPRSLEDIAAEQGVPLDELMQAAKTAITEFRARQDAAQ